MNYDPEEWAKAIGVPLTDWKDRCHEISLACIRADLVEGRVARGWAQGIGGQHSWIATGDPYDPADLIVDPTWWCWNQPDPTILQTNIRMGAHVPHGYGNIWSYGRPDRAEGPIVAPPEGLSKAAMDFLDLIGPMDKRGWQVLLNAPVLGWPAAEIIEAASHVSELAANIPIDVLGMLTDQNPGEVYW